MTLERELIDSVGAAQVEALGGASWRVAPGSAPEVAEVIRRARRHKAAIHPVGTGGRALRGADDRPRGGDDRPRVYLATRRLDQVLQLDEASLLVHAQAGLTGLDLERVLGPRNRSIGDYRRWC